MFKKIARRRRAKFFRGLKTPKMGVFAPQARNFLAKIKYFPDFSPPLGFYPPLVSARSETRGGKNSSNTTDGYILLSRRLISTLTKANITYREESDDESGCREIATSRHTAGSSVRSGHNSNAVNTVHRIMKTPHLSSAARCSQPQIFLQKEIVVE